MQISNWTTRREHRFRDTILFEAMLPARDGSAGWYHSIDNIGVLR